MHLKSKEKPFNFDVLKNNNTFLNSIFEWIFFVLASENEGKIEQLAHFYRKRNFCKNHCFPWGKIIIFLVRSLEKSTKIGCSNAMKNNVKKKASKTEFGKPFGLPKSLKIDPKSDVKWSLLRDAMEPMRNSSQANGRHSLWSVQMATHMIRSSWSAPRRPNHQSKSFNP